MGIVVTTRGIALLVAAACFFLALYTFTGVPQSPKQQLLHSPLALPLDIEEISNNLSQERPACHYLRQDSTGFSLRPYKKPSPLYQPPCPLSDFEDFRFVINANICDSNNVYMMVLVGSHPDHVELRDVIRRTWGQPDIPFMPFRLAFIFGLLLNRDQQMLLELESKKYGDIVQGNFVDSYRNVTLRDLMGLRWAWQYCRQARFVMHADDDVSIDIYGLIDALEENIHASHRKDFVGCFQMMVNTPVLRSGKYEVTKAEHPADVYDPYCQGWMYMLTPRMAYSLDIAALKVPFYWLNDAYITGSLMTALGHEPIDLKINYTITATDLEDAQNRNPNMQPIFTIGPTGADCNLTLRLHENYKTYAELNRLPKHKWTKIQHRSKRTRRLKRRNIT